MSKFKLIDPIWPLKFPKIIVVAKSYLKTISGDSGGYWSRICIRNAKIQDGGHKMAAEVHKNLRSGKIKSLE